MLFAVHQASHSWPGLLRSTGSVGLGRALLLMYTRLLNHMGGARCHVYCCHVYCPALCLVSVFMQVCVVPPSCFESTSDCLSMEVLLLRLRQQVVKDKPPGHGSYTQGQHTWTTKRGLR